MTKIEQYLKEKVGCAYSVQGNCVTIPKTVLEDLISLRDRVRMGITEKHDFDSREGDISQNAGRLYFGQREIERAEAEEIEKIRKIVIPASHTGRLAKGKS